MEHLEKWATITGALLGITAFFWQVHDQFRSKSELVTIEAGEVVIRRDGMIQFPITVINQGERDVFIRAVKLEGPQLDTLLTSAFPRDSIIKLEPGNMARIRSSPLPVLAALSLIQAQDAIVDVRSTRRHHRNPIHYSVSRELASVIPSLGVDTAQVRALRTRLGQECAGKELYGVWRDQKGHTYVGGRPLPGQLTGCIITEQ
ncbi:MAG TPA: hypothetical protein VJT67_02975 [Longimicrobiaceae bacterium]|nr:hypothetical protein [Longimicrobiaceae bacterium]